MADNTNTAKADSTKTAKAEHRHPSFWMDLGREIFVSHGLPFIFKTVLTDKQEDNKRRARNKNYFASAMSKLKARTPNGQRDHDVIQDFTTNWLDDDTDREDFQVNAARVGTDEDAKLDDTVQFLQDLAELPDHATREAVITAYGFIGARSVDTGEKAAEILKGIKDAAVGAVHPITNEVATQFNTAIAALDGMTTPVVAEQKTADALTTAKNRLAAARAKL